MVIAAIVAIWVVVVGQPPVFAPVLSLALIVIPLGIGQSHTVLDSSGRAVADTCTCPLVNQLKRSPPFLVHLLRKTVNLLIGPANRTRNNFTFRFCCDAILIFTQ